MAKTTVAVSDPEDLLEESAAERKQASRIRAAGAKAGANERQEEDRNEQDEVSDEAEEANEARADAEGDESE